MVKRIIFGLIVLTFLGIPSVVRADDVNICPQPYGGGVVCGIHTPVNAGIGDNLALIGTGFLGASAVFAFLSKKLKKTE